MGNAVDRLENMLMHQTNCKFICVTEHWKTVEQLRTLGVKHYELVSSFCRKMGEHGGSAIYVRNDVTWKPRKQLEKISVYGHFEVSAVECQMDAISIIVASIYRPSGGDVNVFFESLESLLTEIVQGWKIIILAGDFNIEMKKENRQKDILFSLISSFGLHPKINDYTRITANSESCLDNIFTNIMDSTGNVFEAHISDHNTQKLSFTISLPIKQPEGKHKRIFSEEARKSFLSRIKDQDWQLVYEIRKSAVDEQWSLFVNTFINIFNECFPLKLVYSKQRNVRVSNQSVKNCKDQLDILLVLSRANPEYVPVYNRAKKEYDRILIKAKSEMYDHKIKQSDNKNKTMWSIAKEIKGNASSNCHCKIPGDLQEVSNDYNRFLTDIVPSLLNNIPDIPFKYDHIDYNNKSMFVTPTTPEEVVGFSKTIKNRFSCGPDEIPSTIVKLCITEIKELLSYIINNSFQYGIFPRQLKVALIRPLYKSGNPELKESYRPISLLNSFSKIFELAMCSRLVSFFNNCKIFSNIQHGYLRDRSTQSAIYQFTSSILNIIEDQKIALGMFLDLSKAFDCLNHEYLIEKLRRYGVRGNALDWLKSYLSDRHQQVIITRDHKTIRSDMKITNVGIPQGSVLGPILFIIFINDLNYIETVNRNCKVTCYADDTNILIGASSPQELVTEGTYLFRVVKEWFQQNKLIINKDKTKLIVFSTNRSRIVKPTYLEIEDQNVDVIHHTKFLGVIIDEFLRWNCHIEALLGKLNSVCYAIRFTSKYLSHESIQILYHANFESIMRYGILFWGSGSDSEKIFIAQKRVIRVMFGMNFRQSCRRVFRSKKILTVFALYLYECSIFLFKNKNLFTIHNTNHTYETRTIDINYPIHRLTLTERNPSYMCIRIYNKLPAVLRNVVELSRFKKKLQSFLIDLEPYNLREFFEGTF